MQLVEEARDVGGSLIVGVPCKEHSYDNLLALPLKDLPIQGQSPYRLHSAQPNGLGQFEHTTLIEPAAFLISKAENFF